MKPHNVSTKDYIIKKIASDIISERIIHQVITHQFESAVKATAVNNSVEISGFGKFVFAKTKAQKQLKKYEDQVEYYSRIVNTPDLDEATIGNAAVKLRSAEENVRILKPKLHNENEDRSNL